MANFDYGIGQVNIDHKTGIRYGVISQNLVLQAWADDSKPNYGEIKCSNCNADLSDFPDECPECGRDTITDYDFLEPINFILDDGEYEAESDDTGDIIITKSPYYTLCSFCSPCAPGAGYLTSKGDVKAYCFGHDFFDDNKAPYTVYDVQTDKEVECPV